ncbi:hypothetical protein VP01_1849g2 [Puccinia sorghi]|uniref:Uncharacterized protein n=1 Tax=Puccinia sorghi TaxID=27349 RepID=A0A0L6VDP4_9BASI|nr:hypothetical protein VP01_1849g2 [Puccinia sorghi]
MSTAGSFNSYLRAKLVDFDLHEEKIEIGHQREREIAPGKIKGQKQSWKSSHLSLWFQNLSSTFYCLYLDTFVLKMKTLNKKLQQMKQYSSRSTDWHERIGRQKLLILLLQSIESSGDFCRHLCSKSHPNKVILHLNQRCDILNTKTIIPRCHIPLLSVHLGKHSRSKYGKIKDNELRTPTQYNTFFMAVVMQYNMQQLNFFGNQKFSFLYLNIIKGNFFTFDGTFPKSSVEEILQNLKLISNQMDHKLCVECLEYFFSQDYAKQSSFHDLLFIYLIQFENYHTCHNRHCDWRKLGCTCYSICIKFYSIYFHVTWKIPLDLSKSSKRLKGVSGEIHKSSNETDFYVKMGSLGQLNFAYLSCTSQVGVLFPVPRQGFSLYGLAQTCNTLKWA